MRCCAIRLGLPRLFGPLRPRIVAIAAAEIRPTSFWISSALRVLESAATRFAITHRRTCLALESVERPSLLPAASDSNTNFQGHYTCSQPHSFVVRIDRLFVGGDRRLPTAGAEADRPSQAAGVPVSQPVERSRDRLRRFHRPDQRHQLGGHPRPGQRLFDGDAVQGRGGGQEGRPVVPGRSPTLPSPIRSGR